MGKICNNNQFFFFANSESLDIVCYIAISLCLLLLILMQYKRIFKKKFKRTKKFLMLFTPLLFTIFFAGTFWILLHKEDYYGCMNSYNRDVEYNKIIIAGDSRMELIELDKDIVLPWNLIFVAKSGEKIKWFDQTAMNEISKIMREKDDNFTYNLVVNMGVNDLDDNIDIDDRADDYFDLYLKLAKDYDNLQIYILSVNPIDEKLIKVNWPTTRRTNEKIRKFNSRMKENLENDGTNNMFYCDAYNDLNFDTDDGLHYTRETNKKIIKYITDDCIKY